MKTIILLVMLGVGFMNSRVNGANVVALSVDDSGLVYQVRISPGTNSVEYDEGAFIAPSPGLCPVGAVAFLKAENGADVRSHARPDGGYTSAALSSTLRKGPRRYRAITNNGEFVSGRHDVGTVLGSLHLCLTPKEIDSIRSIKLKFSVHLRLNGIEALHAVETDWLKFSEQLRVPIRRLAVEHERLNRQNQ
jgi:hypothetical protein